MSAASAPTKSGFLWQCVLIALPVVVLAVFGLRSLRQDRMLAETEARERAQSLADNLQRELESLASGLGQWSQTNPPNTWRTNLTEFRVAFQVSPKGELVSPAPGTIPVPRTLPVEKLSEGQLRFWRAAQSAEFNESNKSNAIAAWRQLLAAEPPNDFQAPARFALGILLESEDRDAALGMFEEVSNGDPQATSDAGISWQQLGRLKWLELTFQRTNQTCANCIGILDALCRDAVEEPTVLTPNILNFANQWANPRPELTKIFQKWSDIWTYDQRAQRLYNLLKTFVGSPKNNPRWFWSDDTMFSELEYSEHRRELRRATLSAAAFANSEQNGSQDFPPNEDDNYLPFVPGSANTNQWIVCVPANLLGRMVDDIIMKERGVPDYFRINVWVAGRLPDYSHFPIFSEDHRALIKSRSELRNALNRFEIGAELRRGSAGPPSVQRNARRFTLDARPGTISVENESQSPGASTTNSIAPFTGRLFASAGRANGMDLVNVQVALIDPSALFRRQRTRTIWFGSLIGFSSLAALIGLIATWKAFQRQERLAAMKSNFVSSVSHELRAPIASVRLLAEGLERGTIRETEKQKEYFGLIVQECRRLTSLIENVLDVSRIEQGRKEYEFEPTDMVALIQQTVKLMETTAAQKHVNIRTEIQETQLGVLMSKPVLDGRAIQQALVNLLDNAIKHTPAGSTVTVGLACRDDNTAVELWVEDHGPGIPAYEHERIFERFYRRGSELLRETQGVGIGLSIVKHIVEAHNGRVTVQSSTGQPTRFTIHIPIAKS